MLPVRSVRWPEQRRVAAGRGAHPVEARRRPSRPPVPGRDTCHHHRQLEAAERHVPGQSGQVPAGHRPRTGRPGRRGCRSRAGASGWSRARPPAAPRRRRPAPSRRAAGRGRRAGRRASRAPSPARPRPGPAGTGRASCCPGGSPRAPDGHSGPVGSRAAQARRRARCSSGSASPGVAAHCRDQRATWRARKPSGRPKPAEPHLGRGPRRGWRRARPRGRRRCARRSAGSVGVPGRAAPSARPDPRTYSITRNGAPEDGSVSVHRCSAAGTGTAVSGERRQHPVLAAHVVRRRQRVAQRWPAQYHLARRARRPPEPAVTSVGQVRLAALDRAPPRQPAQAGSPSTAGEVGPDHGRISTRRHRLHGGTR